jgi:hypothetical protein
MRCEECGRTILNTELWQLGSDPNAPTARSMRTLCWDCRTEAARGEQGGGEPDHLQLPATAAMEAPRAAREIEVVSLVV